MVLGIFAFLSPRRAVIAAFIVAWLFLPVYTYKISGLPNLTKVTITCIGVMLGVLLYDTQRLFSLKFHWLDIPMLLWCFSPFASSLSNGLGAYDGFSESLSSSITWGLPYLIGRMYFNTLEGLRELAIGILIGGLIYVPLCLYEIRMSPQLHYTIYGFHQHNFGQHKRYGGFRPMVFMQHGLAVGLWMATGCVMGIGLRITGVLKRLWIFSTDILICLLLVTTVLCKSLYSLVLLFLGVFVLCGLKWFRSSALIVGLLIVPPIYITVRSTGLWSGTEVVQFIERYVNADRARSLQFRLDNEELLKQKALQRPIFGWGGWERSKVYNDRGKIISTTDSLWIIALGQNGMFGLGCITLALLLPVVSLWRIYPPKLWGYSAIAPAACLAVVITLYMLDNLLNNMKNPLFLLAVGGLTVLKKHHFETVPQPAKTKSSCNPWRSGDLPIYPQGILVSANKKTMQKA